MAGHSHWKQIKLHKGSEDQKRAKIFSKLLRAISAAAKNESNPQFNPRLRATILKAKENQVPLPNIERAIKKASDKSESLEEIRIECYGPGGAAILVDAITDNSNRTMNECKLILKNLGGKLGTPGSVMWAFDINPESREIKAKFPQLVSLEDKKKLKELVTALEDQDDVERVCTNIEL